MNTNDQLLVFKKNDITALSDVELLSQWHNVASIWLSHGINSFNFLLYAGSLATGFRSKYTVDSFLLADSFSTLDQSATSLSFIWKKIQLTVRKLVLTWFLPRILQVPLNEKRSQSSWSCFWPNRASAVSYYFPDFWSRKCHSLTNTVHSILLKHSNSQFLSTCCFVGWYKPKQLTNPDFLSLLFCSYPNRDTRGMKVPPDFLFP